MALQHVSTLIGLSSGSTIDLHEIEMTRQVPVKFSQHKIQWFSNCFLRSDGRMDGRDDFIRHDADLR
jgi:hypothetical protein